MSTRENNIEPPHIDEGVNEEVDENDNVYVAIFTTDKPVSRIRQLGSVPGSLGWTNSFLVDKHNDGTRTVCFDTRFHEVDNRSGEIIRSISASVLAGSKCGLNWAIVGDISKVDLAYTLNGSKWITIAKSVPNPGPYAWTVPNIKENNVMIRISETNGSVKSISDPFKIVK